jgi:uncharacterized OsmC-like protein
MARDPGGETVDAKSLKALQAPLKQHYREHSDAALVTLRAEGEIGEGVTCSVDTGRIIAEAGLHPAAGGTGPSLCSGDMLLEALVACAGVTLNAVATALGLDVETAKVTAEGDIDFRGTLGVDREAPVGFRDIRVGFEVKGGLSDEELDTLIRLTERYCVVYQTINSASPVSVSASRA